MTSILTGPDDRHRYFLNGRRAAGVTSTTGKAMDKPGLVWAAARETALWAVQHVGALDAPRNEESWVYEATRAHRTAWDASARRGTRLHRAAQCLIHGEPWPTTDEDGEAWPEDEIRSAEHLARFMDEWQAEPVAVERPVFHVRMNYAGTLDAIADLRGVRWLLDYKTGKPSKTTGHGAYPKDALQLAAYRYATHLQVADDSGELFDRPMVEVERTGIVWVQPDGCQLLPARADRALWEVFLNMLPVAAFADEDPAQSIGAPLDPEAVA